MAGSSSTSRQLTVVHYAAEDSGLGLVIESIRHLSEAAHVSDVLLCPSGPTRNPGDPGIAFRLTRGNLLEIDLLTEIAGEGVLDRVEVFTTCSAALDAEAQIRTSAMAHELVLLLTGLAADGTGVLDRRVFLPSYGDLCPAAGFFTIGARANLIVIPEDKQQTGSFAKPMTSGDAATFGWHGAVELLSLAGLWSTMDSTPLDEYQMPASGTGEIFVTLARSFVRCAVSDPPSIREMLDTADGLPIPIGLQPAPDPFHHATITADHAFPQEFRAPAPKQFDPRYQVEGRRLLGAVLDRIWLDIRRLPDTLRKGIDQEFDAITAATAGALVGESAWVESVWAGSPTSTERPTPLDPNAVLTDLENRQSSPTLTVYSKESWDRVIDTALGVIDGSEAAAEARQATGSRRYLNVDRPALIPSPTDNSIESSVTALLGASPTAVSTTAMDSTAANGGEGAESTTNGEGAESTTNAESAGQSVNLPDNPAVKEPSDLLSQITRRFQAAERDTGARFEALLERLRTLATPEARGRSGVTRIIQIALIISSALAILAVTTLTPLADRLTFDDLGADNRIRVFAVVSALLAIPIGLLYVPEDRRRAQIFLIALVSSITTVMAVIIVFTPEFQVPITGHEVFRWFLATAITVATVVAASYGLWVTRKVEGGWRWVTRRVVTVAGFLYALSMLVVWINRSAIRPDWIGQNELKLLITTFLVALVVFLTCVVMISVVHIQDENHLDLWSAEFRWLVEEVEEAADNHQIAAGLTAHWLGTAVVLLRLIQRPYGEGPVDDGRNATMPTDLGGIQKFSTLTLDLSDSGRVAFTKRASPMLSPEGWISAQYRKLTTSFLSSQAVSYGTAHEGDDVRPEHCAYPVALQDAVVGQGRGVRWPFAYDFYAGQLDHILRESAEASLARALLDTYLEESGSWTLSEQDGGNQNLSDVFSQIRPEGLNTFTAGLLGNKAAAFTSSNTMTANLWWPANVSSDPQSSSQAGSITEPRGVGSSVLFQAVRVDLSDFIFLNQLCDQGPAIPPLSPSTTGPDEASGRSPL
jgi:hypothetical protein